MPGDEPDFWTGPQWNPLGFVLEYLWAFGIIIALGGCVYAVRTYNSGATDFRSTETFKEALEAQKPPAPPSDGSPAIEESAELDAPPL
eukprot:SM000252S09071  [mRNA]  locus=s252:109985:110564:- [translate_table: standard]